MTLLITLAIIYGVGFVVTLIAAGIAYAVNRDIYDDATRTAAKWFIGSPIWPLLLVHAVIKLVAQMKETLEEDES